MLPAGSEASAWKRSTSEGAIMMSISRAHAVSRPASILFALALLLGIPVATRCHAANLRKMYPELGHRRASLDSVALVVDAIETEDVFGSVEDALIRDSRDYAEQALRLFG